MAQGITNSLNSALMRMNLIENNFQALEKLSSQLNTDFHDTASINNDFKTILDGKIDENAEKNKKVDELIQNSLPDIQTQIQNETLDEALDDKETEKITEIKEALNLKSKIDLKAQITNIEEIIETYSDKYNMDSDFIKAIIKQESNFDANATSSKGAMGLMQLMPSTAQTLGVNDAYDPNQNIEGGVKYLKGLLDRFDNNKELALAAYNAGPSAVKKYGGVPPYKETQNYVDSIMSTYLQVKNAQNSYDGGVL